MRFPLPGRRTAPTAIFRHLAARADAARDAGRFAEAATLYGEALALVPERGDLHVQHGHMLKEAGNIAAAGRAYAEAERLLPDDADLRLQRGHWFRLAGRTHDAADAYRTAARLRPDWPEPRLRLAELEADAPLPLPDAAVAFGAAEIARLAPALAPRPPAARARRWREGIDIHRLGRAEQTAWGERRTLRGVSALRGVCRSARPIVAVELWLDGMPILSEAPAGPFALPDDAAAGTLAKYSFNLWFDVSHLASGEHALELRCLADSSEPFVLQETIVVAPPLARTEAPDSDALVELAAAGPFALAAAIRTAPSVVRPARRALPRPRNVLALRTDQLGDLVSSLPAIRRLREITAPARLVGLLTSANADLARALGLFDEVIVVDFPDDPAERRRLLPLAEQAALCDRLAAYAFDIAVDLADSSVSRELLRLSGARFTCGTGADWTFLSAAQGLVTHDPVNGLDSLPHSAKTLALVEALGAMLDTRFRVVPRDRDDHAALAALGLAAGGYVLFHTGARIAFSRWPHFGALIEAFLARDARTVALVTDDEALAAAWGTHPRVRVLRGRLPFDLFDALVASAAALVGNDSGPKHLAALRGTPVVTIFCARINWAEWAQEAIGTVISRRVPCAGCTIFHDADECAKDFACVTDIRVDEVMAALAAELDERSTPHPDASSPASANPQ